MKILVVLMFLLSGCGSESNVTYEEINKEIGSDRTVASNEPDPKTKCEPESDSDLDCPKDQPKPE